MTEKMFFKRRESGAGGEIINPGNSASEGLELGLARVLPASPYQGGGPSLETLVVILGGGCSVSVESGPEWQDLGQRKNVFDGRSTSVYVPAGREFRVSTQGEAEIALIRAPAGDGGEAYVIRPEDVTVATRGGGAFRREVHTFLDGSRPAASLIAGETFNDPGAWSSYPPHKHDRNDPPVEARLQEVYHFRLQPAEGFGFQRVYSPERGLDCAFTIEDGDSVIIPFGYHPVVAGAGYRLYYLWALAGDGRRLMIVEDPAHSWVGATA
jgi:5-deoxy-glucuronate isomerase